MCFVQVYVKSTMMIIKYYNVVCQSFYLRGVSMMSLIKHECKEDMI